MSKTIEQRLYTAYYKGSGIRLSIAEVDELIGGDESIQTRIINKACLEAGDEEEGMPGSDWPPTQSWTALVRQLKRDKYEDNTKPVGPWE